MTKCNDIAWEKETAPAEPQLTLTRMTIYLTVSIAASKRTDSCVAVIPPPSIQEAHSQRHAGNGKDSCRKKFSSPYPADMPSCFRKTAYRKKNHWFSYLAKTVSKKRVDTSDVSLAESFFSLSRFSRIFLVRIMFSGRICLLAA